MREIACFRAVAKLAIKVVPGLRYVEKVGGVVPLLVERAEATAPGSRCYAALLFERSAGSGSRWANAASSDFICAHPRSFRMRVAASASALATQRGTIAPSRHCLTLRVYLAIEPLRFSIGPILRYQSTPLANELSTTVSFP
jgi:hypothetical protein